MTASAASPTPATSAAPALQSPPPPPVDVYRDTRLRYLGYCNELGESFRPVLPPAVVYGTYAVAAGYCFADARDKYVKAVAREDADAGNQFGDALAWQLCASVAIPGLVINRVVALATTRKFKFPLPTLLGLATIPFIVTPIDEAVTFVMDRAVRPWVFGPDQENKNSLELTGEEP